MKIEEDVPCVRVCRSHAQVCACVYVTGGRNIFSMWKQFSAMPCAGYLDAAAFPHKDRRLGWRSDALHQYVSRQLEGN